MNKLTAFIIILLIISTNITYASFPLDENLNNEIHKHVPDCISEWLLKILKVFLSVLVFRLVVFAPIHYYAVGNMQLPIKVKRNFLFRNGVVLIITLLLLLAGFLSLQIFSPIARCFSLATISLLSPYANVSLC